MQIPREQLLQIKENTQNQPMRPTLKACVHRSYFSCQISMWDSTTRHSFLVNLILFKWFRFPIYITNNNFYYYYDVKFPYDISKFRQTKANTQFSIILYQKYNNQDNTLMSRNKRFHAVNISSVPESVVSKADKSVVKYQQQIVQTSTTANAMSFILINNFNIIWMKVLTRKRKRQNMP